MREFKFSDKLVKVVHREYPPLPVSLIFSGMANRGYWKSFADVDYHIHDRVMINGDFYYSEYHPVKFAEYLKKRLKREPEYINLLVSSAEQTGGELQKIASEIERKTYSNASESELLEDFKRFADAYARYAPAIGIFFILDSLETTLRKALEKAFGKARAREYFGAVSMPLKKNFSTLEEQAFLEIAVQAQKEGVTQSVKERLEEHAREFGWLGTRYGSLDAWTPQQLLERLEDELSKCDDLEKKLREKLAEDEKHAEKIAEAERALSAKDRHLVKVVQEIVYYRTHRTDLINKTFYEIRNLLLKLAKAKGLEYGELLHCTVYELLDGAIPSKQVLQDRIHSFACVEIGEDSCVLTGSEVDELQSQLEEKPLPASELKGKTACAGKARGACKIILSKTDYGKFQESDIIVTSMTTPEMMPLLKKAAAFVTDEGGITCHAAIVSRELGIPCVIGTRVATRVLKDGDLVEVDATKGIVRKLVESEA